MRFATTEERDTIAVVALKEGRQSWRGEGCCDAC
jgi:hypothetical protein